VLHDLHGSAATADLIGLTIKWVAHSYLAEDDERIDNLSLGLSDGTTLILSGCRYPWHMDAERYKPPDSVTTTSEKDGCKWMTFPV